MNSLPKITLAFLGGVASLIIIFIGTSSTKKAINIQEQMIKHTLTDIPQVSPPPTKALPDFASYVDVKEKKSAFFNYLLPHKNLSIESEAEILVKKVELPKNELNIKESWNQINKLKSESIDFFEFTQVCSL